MDVQDFAAFFREVHGYEPFPWQMRLLRRVAEMGKWPEVLDLPTGCGKTAAIDIAVFHLALEADCRERRRAPVRICFVVDRRLVVDDAFGRAKNLEEVLADPKGEVTEEVARRLRALSGGDRPLLARRLRGGIPREDDWVRTPSQPTVLCSTVDQVGSRLLFRGYGVSDSMKPVHAGLIGSDCLILLDEAHLAEPFRQTLAWLQVYRTQDWREADATAPWGVTLLTATPGQIAEPGVSLESDDWSHPVLQKRLHASKPTRLVSPMKSGRKGDETDEGCMQVDGRNRDDIKRAKALVDEVARAFDHFDQAENGAPAPAVGVVVNRVARARAVYELLKADLEVKKRGVEPILMIGPVRPLDRDELVRALDPIRTRTWTDGENRRLDSPLLLVATQCIEAGVDIDLDAVVTEAAPVDALRQRLGRLNRAGRDINAYAAIVAGALDLSSRQEDPVYGKALRLAWDYLMETAGKEGQLDIVDFGLRRFNARMQESPIPPETLSEKVDAPVLLPAHLDLLSQTSPIPVPDPDVALYLHGPSRKPDSVAVVWRADVSPNLHSDEAVRRLLTLVPPRSLEVIELPVWVVRRWLMGRGETLHQLADIAAPEPETEDEIDSDLAKQVVRWKGDNEESRWIHPRELRPGDTIVVPASYGGVDAFGWNPNYNKVVSDLGQRASEPFAGRRFAVRVAPGLLGKSAMEEELADALAKAVSRHWRDLRASVLALSLPEALRDDLEALDDARAGKVIPYVDLYGSDDEDRPRGVVFVAPLGIKNRRQDEDGRPNSTEDDAAGSISGFALSLERHSRDVETMAEAFARMAGCSPARVADLKLAGYLHDAGKADPRFQAWLHYGDPLGPDPDRLETILAKSGRHLPVGARAASGLPANWRHEALSVRKATLDQRLDEADDPELVLWLVGTHHGYGRPLFPHADPTEKAPDVGPQSLAFNWRRMDWATIFTTLKNRYGIWELARMEAIVRLADHRASEIRASEVGST